MTEQHLAELLIVGTVPSAGRGKLPALSPLRSWNSDECAASTQGFWINTWWVKKGNLQDSRENKIPFLKKKSYTPILVYL